jgi:uncharacterized membrane protein
MKLLRSNQLKDHQNKSIGTCDLNFYEKTWSKIENKKFSESKVKKKNRRINEK